MATLWPFTDEGERWEDEVAREVPALDIAAFNTERAGGYLDISLAFGSVDGRPVIAFFDIGGTTFAVLECNRVIDSLVFSPKLEFNFGDADVTISFDEDGWHIELPDTAHVTSPGYMPFGYLNVQGELKELSAINFTSEEVEWIHSGGA